MPIGGRSVKHVTGRIAAAAAAIAIAGGTAPWAQTPVQDAVSRLADFDYDIRTEAARAVRRAPATEAASALGAAIEQSADSYVRFRAFVLLAGFGDSRARDVARAAVTSRDDRLRQAAYDWFERHPDPEMTTPMLLALDLEQAEFVRPSLIRALAALDADPLVRRALVREVGRGLDLFRGPVIAALGGRRATYAVDAIAGAAAIEGPLQDDAVIALGRIGDPAARRVLAEVELAGPAGAITLGAARCLAAGSCDAYRDYLRQLLPTLDDDGVGRAALTALGLFGERGDGAAFTVLASRAAGAERHREPAAVAFALAAVRAPDRVVAWLAGEPSVRAVAGDLLRDGFDMFEEDLAEELFYASVRSEYWKAAEDSETRAWTAGLIDRLGF